MDNPAVNKSHIPCQSWVGQSAWSTTSAQESLFNTLSSSQQASLGLSSGQRLSYEHMQASSQNCMVDMHTSSSAHLSAIFKTSHSNSSSSSVFANTAVPSSSHSISFGQESPQTSSLLLTANQGKNIPPLSLSQTNQVPQPCGPQQLPSLSSHNPYKPTFHHMLSNQCLPNRLHNQPISLPSCVQQGVNTNQPLSGGVNVQFTGGSGSIHSNSSTASQEQCQWILSSHCRGPENESVPDASAHPNKEPLSQVVNIPEPSGDERRRSVLLQQRAQLLQQLAALDKCLESASRDDGSDAHSPHTTNPFPPLMAPSSQCQQNKRSGTGNSKRKECDIREDPVSEAESKGNLSAESEDDGDADYSPNRDNDFPETQAGPDENFSDESSHSHPSPATNEKPFPVKKKAKLEISQIGIRPPIRPTNLRKTSETLVLTCSDSKEKRVYDRMNYCLFCSKPLSKMGRHLVNIHSDKKEVAAALQHPPKSIERRKIFLRIINQGNFAHNRVVLKTGKGRLAVRKRPSDPRKAGEFLNCLYCQALFVKKYLTRHMKMCPDKQKQENNRKIGRQSFASLCVLEASGDLGITEGFKSLLSKMTYDDVTRAILDDELMLQYGELFFEQYGADPKKHEYIRQNLRQFARLLIEAQKVTPLRKLEDFFHSSNFSHVVSAINVLAGYDAEKKRYRIPSIPMKLGWQLQRACCVVEANAVNSGDESLAESAQNFLSEYEKNWNKLISKGALKTLRKNKLKNRDKVPIAQDVKRLSLHMEKVHHLAEKNLRDSPSTEHYVALVRVILARTLIFNRRRASAVSTILLTDFASKKKPNEIADMDSTLSELERSMCRTFTRIDVQVKAGLVPVLLKPSFVSAMEVFINVRDACGIPSENPFLFARPNALTPYSGTECVHKYFKECGPDQLKLLTYQQIRRHYTTMLQLINLDDNEAYQILGPNNLVRALREDNAMYLDDIGMDLEARIRLAVRQCSKNSSAHFGLAEFYYEQAYAAKTGTFKFKKVVKQIHKNKWSEAEVEAVERHMMCYIEQQRVPQKNDCIKCLEAEQEALKDRSWKGVKDYVRNRITSLQCVRRRESQGPNTSSVSKKHHITQQQINLGGNDDQQLSGINNQSKEEDSKHLGDPESDSDGHKTTHKHKWKKAEVEAVERHMMAFIKQHKVPQKNDCIECLEAEPEAMRNRSWKGVKDYIRNRITSLQNETRGGDPKLTTSSKMKKNQMAENQRNVVVRNETGQLGPNNQAQALQQGSGSQQYGIQMDPSGAARGQQSASWNHSQHLDVQHGSGLVYHEQAHRSLISTKADAPPKSANSSKKAAQSSGKNKWREAEVQAVERHMMRFIEQHKIPQKNDCIQCLEAEPEALRARSWKGVKDYVRNRITALTRQGGTFRAASTNSNWSRQEDPQHSQHYWAN